MEQPQLQVIITPESQKLFLSNVGKLLDEAIEEAAEKAKIAKRYVTQQELKKMLQIGAETLSDLEAKGLRRIPLGRKWLYDTEEVAEILNSMKI
ncbi:hypothetical protein ACQV2T_08320 [Facklamia sp. P13069]|uniref:hypothetical protein n=1 Tax=Facklamia sp. P13069 TaxID=3421954 RepID=UPI003D185159